MTTPDPSNEVLPRPVDTMSIDRSQDGHAPPESPEPPKPRPRIPEVTLGDRLHSLAGKYALIGVWILMCAFFGVLMPGKFLQTSTLQALLGSQSSLVFLAAAALCTLVVGEFDLSFAGVMGLAATILTVLSGLHQVPIALACAIALAASAGCGVLNAFFVIRLRVSSLVVTLGTASLFLGISELISQSNTVSISSASFTNIAQTQFLGLPLSFFYGLVVCIVFAYILTWTPVGRHIVFVGSNREVARLAGINVDRVRGLSYVAGGLMAGLAGILLVATVGGFDPTGASDYLLPSLAAVFLGTATVMPGQFNPLGTFLGIYFLETGVIGLQLLGETGWAQDAFYGAGLVLAVALATVVRNRTRVA
jgi:ribose transport system permease protein